MRQSIRRKMILFIGLPAAAISLGVMVWLLAFGKKQARQLKEAEMAEKAANAAAQFESYIGKASRVADMTARFLAFVPNLGDAQIYGLLKGNVRLNERIYGAAMAFEPGVYKEEGVLFSPYVYENREGQGLKEMNIDESVYDWYRDEKWEWWHLPKKLQEGVWTEPYFDEGAGNILMTTYSAPFNFKGGFGGVTTVDIDLERLGQDVRDTIPNIGEFYIIGPKGQVIFSPDPSEIMSRSIQDLLRDASRDELQEAVSEILGGDSGEFTVHGLLHDDPTMYAYAPIHSTDWTFVTHESEYAAMADFERRRVIVTGIFLGAVSLMLGTIFFMSGKVARPIVNLRRQVLRIADGEDDVDLDSIQTRDEIEDLASAFGTMREKVADREEKLEVARETTLTELLESAPDAMIVADTSGRICRVNSKVSDLFGYPLSELDQMKVSELMPKRFREGHAGHLDAYFRDPHARQMGASLELFGIRRDGSEFPIEIGLSPFHEPEGIMAVAAIRDITDRKEREDELRKLNQAVEQSSAAVFITDPDGDIEYVNERFVEITGYTMEEALGQNPRLLKSGLHEPEFYTDVWETLTNGETWHGEFRNRHKDGSLYWASAALSPIRDSRGKTTHYVAIEDDITAEKEAADEIRAKEERFRTLLANLPGTVYRCLHDEQWTMGFISEQVEDLTGYPASDFLGNTVRTFDSVIHPEDRETVAKEVEEAVSSKSPWTIQYRVVHRDGSIHWVGERGRAIHREDGQTDYLDGVIIDITKEKEMEAQVKVAMEQAEEANRAKSDFLSSMSHELRTPLNGVLGYAQILQRDKEATPKQKENLTSIINCGDHLLSLINDVLDLSKIEAGRMDLDEAPCDLNQLIRSISDIVAERARSKDLDFETEVSPEVPRGIVADAPKLRQILVNLLGNAVKFTSEGAVRLKVAETRDRKLAFEVIDTGVGMTPEEAAVVFDPFKQVEAGKAAGGTGLGLAISLQLVEKMGGSLDLETEKGKGSCFRLTLPLNEVEEESLGDIEEEAVTYAEVKLAPGQRVRVLVADDRETNRNILEQLLEDGGFEVALADDGDTAIETLEKEGPFDIVLMDVRMPRMTGIEAVRRIREEEKWKDLPVAAVTASVFPEFREKAIEAGFSDFLPKPFRAAELTHVIQSHLGLEWIPVEEGAGPSGEATDTGEEHRETDVGGNVLLPAEMKDRFHAAMKIKNLSALNSLAGELEANPDTASLGQEISRLTRSFDFSALADLESRLEAEK